MLAKKIFIIPVASFALLQAGSGRALTYTISNSTGTLDQASGSYSVPQTGNSGNRAVSFSITGSFDFVGSTASFSPGQSVAFSQSGNIPPQLVFTSITYTGDTNILFNNSSNDQLSLTLGSPLQESPLNQLIPITSGSISRVCVFYSGNGGGCHQNTFGTATLPTINGSLVSIPSPLSPLSLLAALPVVGLRKRYRQA